MSLTKPQQLDLFDKQELGQLQGQDPLGEVQEARTFSKTALIAILDDDFALANNYTDDFVLTIDSPVKVVSGEDNDRVVGAASVNVEGNQVVADFYIDYQTPERLSIENNELYPNLILKNVGSANGKTNLVIKGISLKFTHPDDRINAL